MAIHNLTDNSTPAEINATLEHPETTTHDKSTLWDHPNLDAKGAKNILEHFNDEWENRRVKEAVNKNPRENFLDDNQKQQVWSSGGNIQNAPIEWHNNAIKLAVDNDPSAMDADGTGPRYDIKSQVEASHTHPDEATVKSGIDKFKGTRFGDAVIEKALKSKNVSPEYKSQLLRDVLDKRTPHTGYEGEEVPHTLVHDNSTTEDLNLIHAHHKQGSDHWRRNEVIENIAKHKNTDPTLLAKLAKQEAGVIGTKEAQVNPRLSKAVYESAFKKAMGGEDTYYGNVDHFLESPHATQEHKDAMFAKFPEKFIKDGELATPAQVHKYLDDSLKSGKETKELADNVLGNKQLAPETLQRLMKWKNKDVAVKAVKHSSQTKELLQEALKSRSQPIREAAANHPMIAKDELLNQYENGKVDFYDTHFGAQKNGLPEVQKKAHQVESEKLLGLSDEDYKTQKALNLQNTHLILHSDHVPQDVKNKLSDKLLQNIQPNEVHDGLLGGSGYHRNRETRDQINRNRTRLKQVAMNALNNGSQVADDMLKSGKLLNQLDNVGQSDYDNLKPETSMRIYDAVKRLREQNRLDYVDEDMRNRSLETPKIAAKILGSEQNFNQDDFIKLANETFPSDERLTKQVHQAKDNPEDTLKLHKWSDDIVGQHHADESLFASRHGHQLTDNIKALADARLLTETSANLITKSAIDGDIIFSERPFPVDKYAKQTIDLVKAGKLTGNGASDVFERDLNHNDAHILDSTFSSISENGPRSEVSKGLASAVAKQWSKAPFLAPNVQEKIDSNPTFFLNSINTSEGLSHTNDGESFIEHVYKKALAQHPQEKSNLEERLIEKMGSTRTSVGPGVVRELAQSLDFSPEAKQQAAQKGLVDSKTAMEWMSQGKSPAEQIAALTNTQRSETLTNHLFDSDKKVSPEHLHALLDSDAKILWPSGGNASDFINRHGNSIKELAKHLVHNFPLSGENDGSRVQSFLNNKFGNNAQDTIKKEDFLHNAINEALKSHPDAKRIAQIGINLPQSMMRNTKLKATIQDAVLKVDDLNMLANIVKHAPDLENKKIRDRLSEKKSQLTSKTSLSPDEFQYLNNNSESETAHLALLKHAKSEDQIQDWMRTAYNKGYSSDGQIYDHMKVFAQNSSPAIAATAKQAIFDAALDPDSRKLIDALDTLPEDFQPDDLNQRFKIESMPENDVNYLMSHANDGWKLNAVMNSIHTLPKEHTSTIIDRALKSQNPMIKSRIPLLTANYADTATSTPENTTKLTRSLDARGLQTVVVAASDSDNMFSSGTHYVSLNHVLDHLQANPNSPEEKDILRRMSIGFRDSTLAADGITNEGDRHETFARISDMLAKSNDDKARHSLYQNRSLPISKEALANCLSKDDPEGILRSNNSFFTKANHLSDQDWKELLTQHPKMNKAVAYIPLTESRAAAFNFKEILPEVLSMGNNSMNNWTKTLANNSDKGAASHILRQFATHESEKGSLEEASKAKLVASFVEHAAPTLGNDLNNDLLKSFNLSPQSELELRDSIISSGAASKEIVDHTIDNYDLINSDDTDVSNIAVGILSSGQHFTPKVMAMYNKIKKDLANNSESHWHDKSMGDICDNPHLPESIINDIVNNELNLNLNETQKSRLLQLHTVFFVFYEKN